MMEILITYLLLTQVVALSHEFRYLSSDHKLHHCHANLRPIFAASNFWQFVIASQQVESWHQKFMHAHCCAQTIIEQHEKLV